MRQTYLLVFLFIATCCTSPKDKGKDKDSDPKPEQTDCIIQEVKYEDGAYDKYTFDANGRLVTMAAGWLNENGTLVHEVPWSYEYTASGMVKTVKSNEGYTDTYNYDASGKLTTVEFKDGNGEIFEKFETTLDAKGRITQLETLYGYTAKYSYDGPNGEISRVEVFYEGVSFDLTEMNSFDADKSKSGFDKPIKGHFFDPTIGTSQMIYYPFNPNGNSMGLPLKGKFYTTYDENWEEITGTYRVYSDFEISREFNTNGYPIIRTLKELLDNSSYMKMFSYQNCK